jgi:hypothetical protein
MLNIRNNKEGFQITATLPLLLVVLTLLAGSARAQQCSDILKYGIYDISKTSSEEKLADSFLQALSQHEVRTQQEAKSFGLKFGVTLPTEIPTPLELGITSTGSKASEYGKRLSSYYKSDRARFSQFRQEVFNVNSNIVKAWSDCVKNNNLKGLICWAEQTENPSEILLKIELRPLTVPLREIKIEDITYSPNVRPKAKFKGKTLSTSVFPIRFTRTGNRKNDAVTFVVTTNDPNYLKDCSAPAFLEAVTSSPNLEIVDAETDENQEVNTGGETVVNFNRVIKVIPLGTVKTGTGVWRFEAPDAGLYEVSARLELLELTNDKEKAKTVLYLYKGTERIATLDNKDDFFRESPITLLSEGNQVWLDKGESIHLKIYVNSNSRKQLKAGSKITIRRLESRSKPNNL